MHFTHESGCQINRHGCGGWNLGGARSARSCVRCTRRHRPGAPSSAEQHGMATVGTGLCRCLEHAQQGQDAVALAPHLARAQWMRRRHIWRGLGHGGPGRGLAVLDPKEAGLVCACADASG
jgi:hypothetical protein